MPLFGFSTSIAVLNPFSQWELKIRSSTCPQGDCSLSWRHLWTCLAETLLLFQIRLKFSSSFGGHEELDKHCFLHTLEYSKGRRKTQTMGTQIFELKKSVSGASLRNGRGRKKASHAGLTAGNSSRETSISSKLLRNNANECPKVAGECYTCCGLFITVFRRWAVQTNTKHPKSCIILVTLLFSNTVRLRAPHACFEIRWRESGELWLQKLWVVGLYFSLQGRDICLEMFLK